MNTRETLKELIKLCFLCFRHTRLDAEGGCSCLKGYKCPHLERAVREIGKEVDKGSD